MLSLALCALAAVGASLTDAEKSGRAIFETGRSASGAPITALLAGGTQPIDAALVPCASCHGSDGRGGKAEAGTRPPDISPQTLAQQAELPLRRRAAYTPALLKRAITLGYDASGNPLDRVMPRFELTQGDVQDLIAYLRGLDRQPTPGIGDDALRIVLLGAPMLEAPNSALYGRRIEVLREPSADALLTIDAREDADASVETAEREHLPTIALGAVHANPGRYAFLLSTNEDDRTATLRAYAHELAPNATTALFADDCRGIAVLDPATLLLLTAHAAHTCDFTSIPIDRRVIVAAAFPPDPRYPETLTRAALQLALVTLAKLGRDLNRETLRTALERATPPRVGDLPAPDWRDRHRGLDAVWLMTLDVSAASLQTVGWHDVPR